MIVSHMRTKMEAPAMVIKCRITYHQRYLNMEMSSSFGAREVTGVDDIRRFFMATATDSRHPGTEMEAKTHARIKQEAQRPIQTG